jgi:hypothetical protein
MQHTNKIIVSLFLACAFPLDLTGYAVIPRMTAHKAIAKNTTLGIKIYNNCPHITFIHFFLATSQQN